MKVRVILHGRSKRFSLIEKEIHSINSNGIELKPTTKKGDAELFAQDSFDVDLLIACGGDGTNHEVVNGLMQVEKEKRPKLGIVPAGSANDFARLHPKRSITGLINSTEKDRLNWWPLLNISSGDSKRYALNLSTSGIGANIAAMVNRRKYKMPPAFNYYSAILYWLANFKAPRLRIQLDEEEFETQSFLMATGFGTYAGNGLGLVPQSDSDRHKMGFTLIGNVGIPDFLRYQGKLKKAQKINDPRVSYLLSKRVAIQVLDGALPVEADGEFFKTLEAGDKIEYSIEREGVVLVR